MSSKPSFIKIFLQFLRLGCMSFGGPAAHLVAFKNRFVDELAWISQDSYQRLFALSHFLPGPSSSQVGFGIGYQQSGLIGGLAAFLGFTLPSAGLLLLLALTSTMSDHILLNLFQSSVKLLIVIVVSDAVISMAKNFCRIPATITIAIACAIAFLLVKQAYLQFFILAACGFIGYLNSTKFQVNSPSVTENTHQHKNVNYFALILFFIILIFSFLSITDHPLILLFNDFFQAGSLVFGGGHVVLPLLQSLVAETLPTDQFLLGYGAAQTIPGPVFSVATFLGAKIFSAQPLLGSLIATLAIFLPGFLLLIGCYRYWDKLSQQTQMLAAVSAINAAVVGLLASSLITPIALNTVTQTSDMLIIAAGFILLRYYRLPILWLLAALMLINTTLGWLS